MQLQIELPNHFLKDIESIKQEIVNLKKSLQPKEPTEYLTRAEVKELLKVDFSTIHNWTKSGKLKAYGVGGRIYYKRSEIDSAIIPLNQ